jgi:hypothetical protein
MTHPTVPPPSHEIRANENRVRLPLVLIVIGLTIWSGFLALGAYLGISEQAPNHDPRRAWVMLISSGGFLLFWLIALVWRRQRLRRTGSRQPVRGRPDER